MRLLLLPVNHVVEELEVPQLILLLYLLMKRYMLEGAEDVSYSQHHPNFACITALCYSQFSALFLPLPVSYLCHVTCSSVFYLCHCLYRTFVPILPVHYSIPNTACIPVLSSCHFLHHSSDAPSPFAVQCATPATACITVLPHHPCQFSVLLFLPLPASQVCPFTIDSSVCYSCHCLYHSSAPSHLPV
jgi:hypothetical protein